MGLNMLQSLLLPFAMLPMLHFTTSVACLVTTPPMLHFTTLVGSLVTTPLMLHLTGSPRLVPYCSFHRASLSRLGRGDVH